jgi:hypothetical protein
MDLLTVIQPTELCSYERVRNVHVEDVYLSHPFAPRLLFFTHGSFYVCWIEEVSSKETLAFPLATNRSQLIVAIKSDD